MNIRTLTKESFQLSRKGREPQCRLLQELLASSNCRSEDIRVLAIVVAELEFCDIERHIFGAHLVERSDNAALEDRPEAFNRVRMHGTDHIATARMVHALVRI